MEERELPSINEIVVAINEMPLGKGEEASVFKVDTNSKYTVRVSNDVQSIEELCERLRDEPFVHQPDIFDGRNYAQSVAYWGLYPDDKSRAMMTINLYVPGFSMEIHKPGTEEPTNSLAIARTIALSERIANMPDDAIDKLYDDLHFLSSRGFSIDTGNGLFTNMGNILLSDRTEEFRIIDLQPFIREHPGINRQHKKGNNTPFGLVQGLLPGMYKYRNVHSTYKPLIDCRTEIVSKVIQGAQRNHLNDFDGYSGNSNIERKWEVLLSQLQIPEKYMKDFIKDVISVEQENRYEMPKNKVKFVRVSGRSEYT